MLLMAGRPPQEQGPLAATSTDPCLGKEGESDDLLARD